MRAAAAGLFCAIACSAPAFAQALSVADTLRALPGLWELDPAETPEHERGAFRCDATPLEIRIQPVGEGEGFLYEAQFSGDETVARSPVMSTPARSGRPMMLVQYEGETATDRQGAPIAWAIEMPDPDHFYFIRRDALMAYPVDRSAMRRRCPGATS